MNNDNNKIYKRCYLIVCAVILVDLIVKFNLMEWRDAEGSSSIFYAIYDLHTRPIVFLQDFFKCDPQYIQTWIFFWVSALLLAFLFLFNLFSHASKGVLLGAPKFEGGKFPIGRYLLLTSVTSLVLSICLCVRWIIPILPEIAVMFKTKYIIVYIYIIFSIFIALFFTLFISFVIAYIIAKAKKKKEAE